MYRYLKVSLVLLDQMSYELVQTGRFVSHQSTPVGHLKSWRSKNRYDDLPGCSNAHTQGGKEGKEITQYGPGRN